MTLKEEEYEKNAYLLLEQYSKADQPSHTPYFLSFLCKGDGDTYEYLVDIFMILVSEGYVKKRNEALPYNYRITSKGREYLRRFTKTDLPI